MLRLASLWWHTQRVLDETRRKLIELPKLISRLNSQIGRGGRYAYLPPLEIARAKRELAEAQALVAQLTAQMRELERQYHDHGYDDVPYGTMTHTHVRAGGIGIRDVGHAVSMAGSGAGIQKTNIEFDIALSAPAVLKAGKAILGAAIGRSAGLPQTPPAFFQPYGAGGRGHHIPAKRTFEGAPLYNAKTALAMSNEEMARHNVRHAVVTGAQKRLYGEFAKTGQPLTWSEIERIEIDALVRGGLNRAIAASTVRKAIEALIKSGVPRPIRIPWGK